MIGTAMALGIGLAATAGTQLVGAKIASNASKDAAKIQSQHADQALKKVDEVWAPYLAHGQQAIGTLGRLTAAPAGSKYAAPPLTTPAPTAAAASRPRPAAAPPTGSAVPRTLGGMTGTGMAPAAPTGAPAPPMPGRMGGPSMVRLQAPNGDVEDVPAHLADMFVRQGAKVLN